MAERLYYADSFLVSFKAHVADIREISRDQGQSLWQIALDRSAFYPVSGGQPADTGSLTAVSAGGVRLEDPVLTVEEDATGEVWHTVSKPLLAGTAVEGNIHWNRRFDHMQQHSGQHLLSAIFRREAGAKTVSFHLGETTSTIDLAVDGVSPEALEGVEETVNRIIAEDRVVRTRSISREEAEELLADGVLAKLPEREGSIRLIEINKIDLNACGGTHVQSTGQICVLLIRGTERVRQGLRVEFVCGLRAVKTARNDLTMLNRTAALLSVGRPQTPEAVERMQAEIKSLQKSHHKLVAELADYHATRLVVEEPIEGGLRMVRRTFPDRDAAYIKLLASRLAQCAPQTCALLASTAEEPARLVMACGSDLELDCGAVLREALEAYGARGGGSPEMAQGQVPKAHLESLMTSLKARFIGPDDVVGELPQSHF